MSTCADGADGKRKECARTAERRRDECVATRDEGRNECVATREERQKKCCDWIPCSWACKAFHWLVSIVCVAWEWVAHVVCVAWNTIVEVVCVFWTVVLTSLCAVLDAVVSIAGLFVAIVGAALNWAWSALGYLLAVLTMIPGIGPVFAWILNLGATIINGLASLPDAALTLVGIMPEKKLRLGIIVLKDQRGVAAADDVVLLRAIQCTMNILREQANVRVIPIRYAQYNASFEAAPVASTDFIFRPDEPSEDKLLDVCCDACGFGEGLGDVGAAYNALMTRVTFWGNGRRLLGYGAPIVAFAVRSFRDGKFGCSLGPLTGWVTVDFEDSENVLAPSMLTPAIPLGRISTLTHEIGHACGLLIHAPDGGARLMSTTKPRFCRLTRWEKAVLRSSRHVTYL